MGSPLPLQRAEGLGEDREKPLTTTYSSGPADTNSAVSKKYGHTHAID